jgi:hypothetical protein
MAKIEPKDLYLRITFIFYILFCISLFFVIHAYINMMLDFKFLRMLGHRCLVALQSLGGLHSLVVASTTFLHGKFKGITKWCMTMVVLVVASLQNFGYSSKKCSFLCLLGR